VKLKFLLAIGVVALGASGVAEAKYVSHKLRIEGPGMPSPGVVHRRSDIDRLSNATLEARHEQTDRPASTGPAYLLEYRFAVGDADGSRVETVRQTLYPFAEGGPVVFTARGQMIDMSFGPVRFDPGWYEVPGWVIGELRRVGLPDAPTNPVTAPNNNLPSRSSWPLVAGLAALTAVGAVAGARRRSTRP
jgi:hypothetical protein